MKREYDVSTEICSISLHEIMRLIRSGRSSTSETFYRHNISGQLWKIAETWNLFSVKIISRVTSFVEFQFAALIGETSGA